MNEATAHEQLVKDYFNAFEARDLSKCIHFFQEDAILHFATGKFPGKKAIEQWHNDRFKGGMKIVEIEEVEVQDNTVIVHAVVTSPKLKLVRIDDFRGTGTFLIHQNKFKEVRMGLRTGYRFHI